jgi:diguanylate cyclase (GGDEF)-like protein
LLDRFKQVNDSHGHDVGDRLVTVVGERLRGSAQQAGGFAARLGGDEFLVVLPTSAGDNVQVIASMLARIEQPARRRQHHPRVSAGICVIGALAPTWHILLRQVDLCLYEAKLAGLRHVAYWAAAGLDHPYGREPKARRRHINRTTHTAAQVYGLVHNSLEL